MHLEESQIIKLVESRPNSGLIQKGLNYESLLKVFTEPFVDYEELNKEKGWEDILETIEAALTKEKYLRTLDFVRTPLPVINISEDVLADINKVFEPRNANFQTFYPHKSQEEQGEAILAKINVRKFIERNGKKVFKNKPNSFVVVDKNKDGEPFLIFVTNDMLRGLPRNWDGEQPLDFIMFLHSIEQDEQGRDFELISFYDDTHYRVLSFKQNVYEVLVENEHNLEYCPAIPFLNITLNSSNALDRYSPLARVISTMVDWTVFDIYNRFCEHYNVYPIVEQPKISCNNDDCIDGTITTTHKEGNTTTRKCDICSKSPLLGPGAIFLVDPASRKDELDVFGKIRYVSPPIDNLVKSKEFQVERQGFIKVNVTGVNNVITKEAVNTDQIKAVMEDRRKPLLFLSKPLNDLDTWIIVTIIKLAMNVDVKRHSNFGTEWFLLTELEIQTLFAGSKTVGLPEGTLDLYYKLLIETQYKNDPHTVRKLVIENNLNPAPYKTMEEAYVMFEKRVMSLESLTIKANITAFIERFERENGNIVEFAQEAIFDGSITFADKINTITEEFLNYIKEQNEQQEIRADDSAQQGEGQGG